VFFDDSSGFPAYQAYRGYRPYNYYNPTYNQAKTNNHYYSTAEHIRQSATSSASTPSVTPVEEPAISTQPPLKPNPEGKARDAHQMNTDTRYDSQSYHDSYYTYPNYFQHKQNYYSYTGMHIYPVRSSYLAPTTDSPPSTPKSEVHSTIHVTISYEGATSSSTHNNRSVSTSTSTYQRSEPVISKFDQLVKGSVGVVKADEELITSLVPEQTQSGDDNTVTPDVLTTSWLAKTPDSPIKANDTVDIDSHQQLTSNVQVESISTRGSRDFNTALPVIPTTLSFLNNSDITVSTPPSPNPCFISPCGPLATCTPFLNSFLCSCIIGYQGDPPSTPCTLIDHCQNIPCGENTVCHNKLSGHLCQCLPGFFSSSHPSHSCQDVDECSSVPGLCGDNSICTNTVGSFMCTCEEGFSSQGGLCKDVNECETEQHMCVNNTYCNNTEGGYSCTCKEGFRRESDYSCKDIDECVEESDLCGTQSLCINTNGSYECRDTEEHSVCNLSENGLHCECAEGYEGNPPQTPCTRRLCQCGPNAECAKKEGLDKCICIKGFRGDPPAKPCQRVDECHDHSCGSNAKCSITNNGTACTCLSGFKGDGYTGCYLPTKCSSPLDCPKNTTCKLGTCRCKAGFSGGSQACVDKDECSMSDSICGDNASCINIVGGYLCACRKGYDRYPPLYNCTPVNNCKMVCGNNSTCTWIKENQNFGCSCDTGFVELISGGCVKQQIPFIE